MAGNSHLKLFFKESVGGTMQVYPEDVFLILH